MLADWRVIGEYVHDADGGRHQAFYVPVRPTVVFGETIETYERVHVEQSVKYSPAEADNLWRSAGLAETCKWQNKSKEHGTFFLSLFFFCFLLRSISILFVSFLHPLPLLPFVLLSCSSRPS